MDGMFLSVGSGATFVLEMVSCAQGGGGVRNLNHENRNPLSAVQQGIGAGRQVLGFPGTFLTTSSIDVWSLFCWDHGVSHWRRLRVTGKSVLIRSLVT